MVLLNKLEAQDVGLDNKRQELLTIPAFQKNYQIE
jgi:hypothetical protein